jgi:hypothetical protein
MHPDSAPELDRRSAIDHRSLPDHRSGRGTIDSIQVTSHITFTPPDKFNLKDFNFGTCASPED